LIFAVLAALTLVVWMQQIRHERNVLERHTQDVCLQASRRLEIFIDSRLTVVEVFATRWATHGQRDYSRQRFEEFAAVLFRRIPGFQWVGLVSPAGEPGWSVSRVGAAVPAPPAGRDALFEEALRTAQPVLSAPGRDSAGAATFFAVLPLHRDAEFLGFLLAEFRVGPLMEDCFHERIRSEFDFLIQDGEETFYTHLAEGGRSRMHADLGASRVFPVRNREWRLIVAPRASRAGLLGMRTHLSVPVLGLLLSIGIAALVQMLSSRLRLYREARDRAWIEMREREKAQSALKDSEARYRSVFDSAVDGLVVLDPAGRVVEANRAAEAQAGRRVGELDGARFAELVAEEQRGTYEEFARSLEGPRVARLATTLVARDGSRLAVELRGTRFDHAAEPRVLLIVTDVSEMRRAERRQTQLSRKVLMAQEEERARLSRDLHDDLGQILSALRLELALLARQSAAGGDAFQTCFGQIEQAAEALRRICRGLRPPLLDDLGVEPAVQQLVREFEEHSGIAVDLEIGLDEERTAVRPETALATYRILQEALTNAGRHAGARNVNISLYRDGAALVLSVYDDGRGFDAASLGGDRGSGLQGMRERAALVNGVLEIQSIPSEGTRIRFRAEPAFGSAGSSGEDA